MQQSKNRHSLTTLFLFIILLATMVTACQNSPVAENGTIVAVAATESITETPVAPTATQTGTKEAETKKVIKEVEEAVDEATATRITKAASPTATVRPSATPAPSATPTSEPQFAPSLGISEPQALREGVSTPATAIPTAVPAFSVPKGTTNVLLLGSDAPVGDNGIKRTDTMIVVSINRDGPTASMISLPRDLYVYIPGGTMNRLNAAITIGGVNLLKQTILYNFGIPIHYFARVDFEGFEEIVDSIGGVELAVGCGFKDWRIKSPELDPENEDNWYVHELEPGMHTMDGDTALWYARSRLMSNDFDRGRRQQQLLRSMLNQGVDLGLVPQVPSLWGAFQDTVETDMDIGRMLQIASLAPAIRENGVQNLYLLGKTESWIVPATAAQVQLPIWDGQGQMGETIQRLFLPPALNKASRAPIFVEVVNASGNPDMAALATDNLAWYGFVPIVSEEEVPEQESTTLTYFAPNFKGSYNWMISWIFDLAPADIILDDENPFASDYQVVLGEDYDPCLNPFYAPQAFLP